MQSTAGEATAGDGGSAIGLATSSLQFVGLTPASILPANMTGATNSTALRQLYDKMSAAVIASESVSELIERLVGELESVISVALVHFYIVESSESLQLVYSRGTAESQEPNRAPERSNKQLDATCKSAIRMGQVEFRRQLSPSRTLMAIPIDRMGATKAVIGFMFVGELPDPVVISWSQYLAGFIQLWNYRRSALHAELDAEDSSFLVELMEVVVGGTSVAQACFLAAGELHRYLKADRVFIGICPGSRGHCRLQAISQILKFDPKSETARSIESALNEAVLQGATTQYSDSNIQTNGSVLSLKSLCLQEGVSNGLAVVLRDAQENIVGAIACFHASPSESERAWKLLELFAPSLASAFQVARRVQGNWVHRQTTLIRNSCSGHRWKIASAVLVSIVAMAWIPWTYRIRSECKLEPVVRRYVAAPFEGTLDRAFVKPGDLIRQGDLVARMDGREIRWKMASHEADLQQSLKKRDSAQASHNYAEQQIAQLDVDRLRLEMQLLRHREENLEIRSPIDGVVASGDLERAEGAPLKVGQTLFEIGPMDALIVEIAVPDCEISHIEVGQEVFVRVDAYPGETWSSIVTRIQPKSEIRDEQNVFILEAEIQNNDGRLKPGMRGAAKVTTSAQPIGWILFHKPWEYVCRTWAW